VMVGGGTSERLVLAWAVLFLCGKGAHKLRRGGSDVVDVDEKSGGRVFLVGGRVYEMPKCLVSTCVV
jgi:hypothetical protein